MTTRKNYTGEVPFGMEGLQHYPGNEWIDAKDQRLPAIPPELLMTLHDAIGPLYFVKTNWVQAFEFVDTLEIDHVTSGRSAKYVWWVSKSNGLRYPMFVSELAALIKDGKIEAGLAMGAWGFCKRGANFGIRYLGGVP